jgi:hypothetical protein
MPPATSALAVAGDRCFAACRTTLDERTAIEWIAADVALSWVTVGVVLAGVGDSVADAATALESPTLRTSAQARRSQPVSRPLASIAEV